MIALRIRSGKLCFDGVGSSDRLVNNTQTIMTLPAAEEALDSPTPCTPSFPSATRGCYCKCPADLRLPIPSRRGNARNAVQSPRFDDTHKGPLEKKCGCSQSTFALSASSSRTCNLTHCSSRAARVRLRSSSCPPPFPSFSHE